jgi:hypothetical protein
VRLQQRILTETEKLSALEVVTLHRTAGADVHALAQDVTGAASSVIMLNA